MVEIDTLFQTKTAEKNIPSGAAHTHIAHMRDSPRGVALQIIAAFSRCLRKRESETNKISKVWNSANILFKWIFGLLSSKNFAIMTTWRNGFSSLWSATGLVAWVCAATFSLMKFAAQLKSCKIASWRFLFHTAIGNILKMGAGIVGAKKASY